MNILMIGTTDKRGGAAKVGWEIKAALEGEGNKINFFVADKKSSDSGVKVIPRSNFLKIIGFIMGTERFIRTDWILNTPEFKEADIIHCHNLHGRFFNLETLKKMSKLKPVVWTLHDEWAITPHCAFTFEGDKVENGFYVCPNKDIPPRLLWHSEAILEREKKSVYNDSKFTLVTPSRWLLDRVKNSVLKDKDIRLIYNGINTDIFKKSDKESCRRELDLPLDKKIIFFLADGGTSNPWKGWNYTEAVIKRIGDREDIVFVCAGNDQAHQEQKNIIYRPLIKEPEKMAKYYSACDVFLYSSLADNFPLVILEAMSCGLPIISFNTGGIKEVLTHKKNGYIAEYKDVADLSAGLNYVLGLKEEIVAAMARDSIEKIAAGFNVKKMVDDYDNLYRELISSYEKQNRND